MRSRKLIRRFLRSGNVADREAGEGPTRRRHGADLGASAASSPAEFISHSSEETIAKGREIAASLRPPVIVMLSGELGSGKTTLTKGIISGLGAAREEDVTSPTFTLVHVFHNDSLAGSKSPTRHSPAEAARRAGSQRHSPPQSRAAMARAAGDGAQSPH